MRSRPSRTRSPSRWSSPSDSSTQLPHRPPHLPISPPRALRPPSRDLPRLPTAVPPRTTLSSLRSSPSCPISHPKRRLFLGPKNRKKSNAMLSRLAPSPPYQRRRDRLLRRRCGRKNIPTLPFRATSRTSCSIPGLPRPPRERLLRRPRRHRPRQVGPPVSTRPKCPPCADKTARACLSSPPHYPPRVTPSVPVSKATTTTKTTRKNTTGTRNCRSPRVCRNGRRLRGSTTTSVLRRWRNRRARLGTGWRPIRARWSSSVKKKALCAVARWEKREVPFRWRRPETAG